jgi:4-amino-4-deoxy-L-arabinose transferase-like glycosyltransferase
VPRSSPTKSPAAWLAPACLAWLAVRLVFNGLHQLVPDEAYYWVWSRHPALGYLDHPPMVAWIIRAGTALLGTSEFGVRGGAAILTLGAILVTIALAGKFCPDRKAVLLAAGILLLSPITAVLGTIITPDTPACFFSISALAAAVAASSRGRWWWLAFGVSMGLALLSKYTAVLAGAAIALALLSTPHGRRQLASPWPWLGCAAAALVFWPVVQWNREHDWASFRFQWHHGTSADPSSPLANLASYFGGQLAIFTPILFVLGIAALIWQWRQFKMIDTAERMVLLAATVPLVFFCLFSLRHRPEANWPVFAYLPLTIILVQWLSSPWKATTLHWTQIGIIVAAVAMVVGQTPEIIQLVPVRWLNHVPRPWREMVGWRELAAALDQRSDGAVVYCTLYQSAAEASFYMTGRPEVWMAPGNRPTAYDFFPAALRRYPGVTVEQWHSTALGRFVRQWQFIIARKHPGDATQP